MAKKENLEAKANTVEGEAKVKKESKIKNAFYKTVIFIAENRGKIALAVGLIAGAAGGVAVAKRAHVKGTETVCFEADYLEPVEVTASVESSEVI